MDKIIGFTISKNKIDHTDIDVFHRGIVLKEFRKNGYYVYFWGIGNPDSCKVNGKYSLGFPISETFLDRNILVEFTEKEIIVENDWLGSIPVFFNDTDCIVSTLSLKTLTNGRIHPEGLANFVECGFSILGQTPFQDVKILRYFSKLTVSDSGIICSLKDDPILDDSIFSVPASETEIFEKIKNHINIIERQTKDEIIIPTSGGFDSRLLNLCVEDKSRIRAFSYGISDIQSESFEIVYAKKTAEILNISWEQVELGRFHEYMEDWFRIYGISTHLHGMYHIEFYKTILQNHKFGENTTLLSGIFGDVWSGNVTIPDIVSIEDLPKIMYSHGMNADRTRLQVLYSFDFRKEFIHANREILNQEPYKIIFLIRMKIILISYLLIIPEYFGMPAWSPFLNFEIATGILKIPKERRKNRMWQQDLFRQYNLDIENRNLQKNTRNTLNRQAFAVHKFTPLNITLLQKYVEPEYLFEINKFLSADPQILSLDSIWHFFISNRYSRFCLRHLGIYSRDPLSLLYAYYVLKPIELGLIKGAKDETL